MHRLITALTLLAASGMALAGPAMDASGAKQATNWHAIIMFLIFVAMTMGITYWAAGRTKSTADVIVHTPLRKAASLMICMA